MIGCLSKQTSEIIKACRLGWSISRAYCGSFFCRNLFLRLLWRINRLRTVESKRQPQPFKDSVENPEPAGRWQSFWNFRSRAWYRFISVRERDQIDFRNKTCHYEGGKNPASIIFKNTKLFLNIMSRFRNKKRFINIREEIRNIYIYQFF